MESTVELARYSDQYGSWVRVSHEDVLRFGFVDQVYSRESRITLAWVYLYGDDGLRLIEHLSRTETPYVVQEMGHVERSTIRKMQVYDKRFLLFVPLEGRVIKLDGLLWRVSAVRQRGGSGNVIFEPFTPGAPGVGGAQQTSPVLC